MYVRIHTKAYTTIFVQNEHGMKIYTSSYLYNTLWNFYTNGGLVSPLQKHRKDGKWEGMNSPLLSSLEDEENGQCEDLGSL